MADKKYHEREGKEGKKMDRPIKVSENDVFICFILTL